MLPLDRVQPVVNYDTLSRRQPPQQPPQEYYDDEEQEEMNEAPAPRPQPRPMPQPQQQRPMRNTGRAFTCPNCGKKFRNQSGLDWHLQNKTCQR